MKVIGTIDLIDLPEFGIENIEAKIDTGANRSSLHCTDIHIVKDNGLDWLYFTIPLVDKGTGVFKSDDFFSKDIKSSSGHIEHRYIIKTKVILFGKIYKTSFSLTNREEMKYPILLGSKLLKNRFMVDVSKKNLSYNGKKKHS